MKIQDPIYHLPTKAQAAQRTRPNRPPQNTAGERRRKQILDFLVFHQLRFGFSPSIREIGDAVGLGSSSTVHGHLKALKGAGKIARNPCSPRSIEIKCMPPVETDFRWRILGPDLFAVTLRGSREEFKGLEKILGGSTLDQCELYEVAGGFLEQLSHLTNGTALTYPDIARSSLPGSNGADK